MSLCISPQCLNPQNPDNNLFCHTCGSELLLEGRYRVMRLLGSGGFGTTYQVLHSGTSKVLKILLVDEPKAVSLFQQEARVLTLLDHPGIPKADLYFTCLPKNSKMPLHCLIMEHIEGLNLKQYLEQRGNSPIGEKLAVEWLIHLTTILHEVHSQQFFHRDIKPSNIMLRSDGQLVLIDFGTVREVNQTYKAKQVTGGVTSINSAGYTPPEQINCQAVPQSDFFALGRTFVYLLTGRSPTDPEIYDAFNDQLNWQNYAPQISPNLVSLLEQMMARSPSQRPKDTSEILHRLHKIKDNLQPTSKRQLKAFSNSSQPTLIINNNLSQHTISKSRLNSAPSHAYALKIPHILLVTGIVSLLWCCGILFSKTIAGMSAEMWNYSQLIEQTKKSNIKQVNLFNFNGIVGNFLPSPYQAIVFTQEGKKVIVYIYNYELDNDPDFVKKITADTKFNSLISSLVSKSKNKKVSTHYGEEKTIWFGGISIFIISSTPALFLLLKRS